MSKIEVVSGEAVGMLAAQSIAEPITQALLRLFHEGGTYSELAVNGISRFEDIFYARKKSECMKGVFLAYEMEGIESARNALAEILEETFILLEISIDMRHLLLIADAMTYSGRISGIDRLMQKQSVLGRAASHAANRHLAAAAVFGEKDYLLGNIENILVGRQIAAGTGSVKLSIDRNINTLRDRIRTEEPEFEDERVGNAAYATDLMDVGKNLGARNPTSHPSYLNLVARKRPLGRPGYKPERNFYNANPVLRLVCGKFNLPLEMRDGVAVLYRKCINRRLTNGRDTYAMAIAVVSILCEEWGVKRDTESIAKELGIRFSYVDSCLRIIKSKIERKT